MPLLYLDKTKMKDIIAETWKKHKNTSADPANGRHYETNPDGSQGGLYGALEDEIDKQVYVDEGRKSGKTELITCFQSDTDNRDGKTPKANVTLTYQHSKVQSQTHTVSNQIGVGVGVEVKIDFEFVETNFKYEFNYEYKVQDSNSKSETEASTYSTTVMVEVPAGKVYRTILTGTKCTATVPTRTYINLRGTSNAWYEDRVDGHYNWRMEGNELCDKIREHHTAGSDSDLYKSMGDHGAIEMPGEVTGVRVVNFSVVTKDVTPKQHREAGGENASYSLHLPAEPDVQPEGFLKDPSIVKVYKL